MVANHVKQKEAKSFGILQNSLENQGLRDNKYTSIFQLFRVLFFKCCVIYLLFFISMELV